MGTYTIGEVAARTGVPATALRYYEGIGLVTPAGRTDAGYRLYDDTSLARLAFIARAKQLGCTLEEVADLADAWDNDECAPVKHRLRGLVAAKLHETEQRMRELRALQADLRATATMLESAPLDGPCDESCGCTASSGPVVVPFTTKRTTRRTA